MEYFAWRYEKLLKTYGIRLPDGQNVEDIHETGYTYLGILETDKVKKKEIKKIATVKTDIKIETEWEK